MEETKKDYEERVSELDHDEPGWREHNKVGSLGCHELLDRVAIAMKMVDELILFHPSAALSLEWYTLASQAFGCLFKLYQSVGAAHLSVSPESGKETA